MLGAAGLIGAQGVLFLEFLIVLTYSAVVAFLRIGRLAAYVTIAYGIDEVAQREIPFLSELESGAVDASELILSDVPLPAS